MSSNAVNIVLTMPRTRKQWTVSLAVVFAVLLGAWTVVRWGYLRHEDALTLVVHDIGDIKTNSAVQVTRLDGIDSRLARIEDAIFRTFGARSASYQPAPKSVAAEVDRE